MEETNPPQQQQKQREQETPKWEGWVEVPMAAPLERVWEIASDFYALDRWHPALQVCEKAEGPDSGPGCVRYCAAASPDSAEGISWVKEKLVSFDPANRIYTYVVVDGNMDGLLGYEGTFHVVPAQHEGCLVKWYFRVAPVAGYSREGFVGYLSSVLTGISNTLEQVASS